MVCLRLFSSSLKERNSCIASTIKTSSLYQEIRIFSTIHVQDPRERERKYVGEMCLSFEKGKELEKQERWKENKVEIKKEGGGDTSITKETSKEAPKQYNQRNERIRSHLYQVNNMLIMTKKFKNLSF